MKSVDTGSTAETDRQLALREDALYQQIGALRRDDAAADYKTFVQLATQRHAIRALRAALIVDGLSAAAHAAFETISAMKFDDDVMQLGRDTLKQQS